MTIGEFAERIDWPMLRQQKSTLLKVITDGIGLDYEDKGDLTGILHLLDDLMDESAEALSANVVFGTEGSASDANE
jgi:hypothetical protein